MFVRVSRGTFPEKRYKAIAKHQKAIEPTLAPAVRELPGLIDYYAAIDRDSRTLIRISLWVTADQATALGEFAPIVNTRTEFEGLGVVWEPTITYEVDWWVQPS
jgi:hypothetical protein